MVVSIINFFVIFISYSKNLAHTMTSTSKPPLYPKSHLLAASGVAAFLSFAFNVGNGAFCGSTLTRKANAGDMPGACAELSRWTYAGGKQMPGLVIRRAAERQLCERGLS